MRWRRMKKRYWQQVDEVEKDVQESAIAAVGR